MKKNKISKVARYIMTATGLFFFGFMTSHAGAAEDGLQWGSALKFSAGIVSAFLIHEGSHALVAGLTNTDLHWETGTLNQPIAFTENANTDSKGFAINSAGLISQAVGGEIILQADRIDKNDAFVRGMMTWNILNPVLYSLDYWIFHSTNKINGNSYQGDLAGIERYSNKATADGFALSMSAIAVFQGYRFLKTQSWAPDWLKENSRSMSLAPLPSGGFIVGCKFDF
ncbi:MAG: hypothetical protein ABSB32_23565 [Thermodesulfobacteriota bacterium]|jgi:hypothetical protein